MLLLLLWLCASVDASKETLDCPLRQIGLDFAQTLQPFRSSAVFQEVADALNGSPEAQNCSVAPSLVTDGSHSRVLSYDLPSNGRVFFVCPRTGGDYWDGTVDKPFLTIERGLKAIRDARAKTNTLERATLVLREGVFHVQKTIQLTPEESYITFQAYPGEEVRVSGSVPINGLKWEAVTPPKRDAYEMLAGDLGDGFDVRPSGSFTRVEAEAECTKIAECSGFMQETGSGRVTTYFKYANYFSSSSKHVSFVKNRGYVSGAHHNLFSADVSHLNLTGIDSLRINGEPMIRARYPNAGKIEYVMGAMQIVANAWTPQPQKPVANYTFNPTSFKRTDTADNFFQEFRLGVGGACSDRFTPAGGYWCAEGTQGGGPGPYRAPVAMTVARERLPHTPYTGDVRGMNVHSWRAGRWFSWVFHVDGSQWDEKTSSTTFSFSRKVGGNQGSRGGTAGQEFFVENVQDELDNPGEFFYDARAGRLYVWFNSTAQPSAQDIAVPVLRVIVNTTGTQRAPVKGVQFKGLHFRDAAPAYLEPHGTPSGGDWAVTRSGALFFEGTEDCVIDGCLLAQLDGSAVFLSGYNRRTQITHNEFTMIGETCVQSWGKTAGSPIPGMGFNATDGNQPQSTNASYNYMHEMGIFTKQNSAIFQATSYNNHYEGNIAFNGPRAGVNFNDGLGGGSVLTRNVLFNFCRESSDHGNFNSWDRQVYIFPGEDGKPTVYKRNDTISHNWMLANYHSSMAIDNDDGSCYYDTHHNVLISASSGAAYGGNSLKSDFGGHDNYHHDNLDLFWSKGFGICKQIHGHADGYYGNYLYLADDGAYGSGQVCTRDSESDPTVVHDNTIWSPTGKIDECHMSLAEWQAKGGDKGTTAVAYPHDDVVLKVARDMLGL